MHPPHAIHLCIHHMHEPSCAMRNPPTPPQITHPPPRDRSTDPFSRHAPPLRQQPTSISPSPPQLNTPQQPTHHLHRTPQAIHCMCHQPCIPTSHRPTCPIQGVDLPPLLTRNFGQNAPPTCQGTQRNQNRLLTRPETSVLNQVKLVAPCQ